MYERFTDRARKVMQLANQEAQRFNHEYIGTEHMLLGLVRGGGGAAARILRGLDVDLRKIRLDVEKLISTGPDMILSGKLPQTPRTKKVIEYSMEEARDLKHNYVGTEHVLLGLLRDRESVAGCVLMNLGVTRDAVRDAIENQVDTVRPESIYAEDDRNCPKCRGLYSLLIEVLNAGLICSRRINELEEFAKDLLSKSNLICAFCGTRIELTGDFDIRKEVQRHTMECAHHPLFNEQLRRMAAETKVAELTAQLLQSTACLNEANSTIDMLDKLTDSLLANLQA